MATESIQEKRARLLSNGGVQDKIRRRSFEIYLLRMRHRYPGDQNSDWLQAEGEVLDEMLAQEIDPLALLESAGHPVAFGGGLELEIAEPVEAPVAQATEEPVEKKKSRSTKAASPRKPKAKAEAVEGEKKKAARSTKKSTAEKKASAEKTPKKTAKKSSKTKPEE